MNKAQKPVPINQLYQMYQAQGQKKMQIHREQKA